MPNASPITSPQVAAHHELILLALSSTLGDRRVIYLSGPITTGLGWVDAVQQGAQAGTRELVKAENTKRLSAAAARLRRENPTAIVVDPASFTATGWSQDDYLLLWKSLIERHAGEVRFLPNWQYSIGCVREFEHAVVSGVRTSDIDGTVLSVNMGIKLLQDAAGTVEVRYQQAEELGPLLQALKSVLDAISKK